MSLLLFQQRAARGDHPPAARVNVTELSENKTSADSQDVLDVIATRDVAEVSVPVVVSIQPGSSDSGTRG